MGANILPTNHYSLSTFSAVNEICQPFFKKTGLNIFIYCRHYKDGSYYSLSTHREYYQHHFKKEWPLGPTVQKLPAQRKFYYLPTAGESKVFDRGVYEIAEEFNIAHPFYIMERNPDYLDIAVFGAELKKFDIVNFYLNYPNVLENFKAYFVERAEELIKKSEKNKIVLPAHMRPAESSFVAVNQRALEVTNKLRIDRIYLNHINGGYLTQREFECIKLLILGKSAEEIGLIVGLSKRTVEKYLENIKKKFYCTKTTQLIYELTKAGLVI